MYDSLIISSSTRYTIGGWYHGGINMCVSRAKYPNNLINGLNGGPPRKSPLGEFPLSEFPSCPPSSG
jgi:hypothetical protein